MSQTTKPSGPERRGRAADGRQLLLTQCAQHKTMFSLTNGVRATRGQRDTCAVPHTSRRSVQYCTWCWVYRQAHGDENGTKYADRLLNMWRRGGAIQQRSLVMQVFPGTASSRLTSWTKWWCWLDIFLCKSCSLTLLIPRCISGNTVNKHGALYTWSSV